MLIFRVLAAFNSFPFCTGMVSFSCRKEVDVASIIFLFTIHSIRHSLPNRLFEVDCPAASGKGSLLGRGREKGGRCARRDREVQLSISDIHTNSAKGRGLSGFDPCNAVARLRVDKEVFISGMFGVGANASQSLIEPDADAVIAIVYAAAVAVPRLPSSGCTLLYHV